MNIVKNIRKKGYQFLRWSQKYTKTDMVYLVKGGFWFTLKQVVSTATSFLLAIAFANLLDSATYGNYNYIMSFRGILGILTLAGMNTATTQAVARGLEGSFYSGFKTRLKWGLSASLIALTIAIYYFLKKNYLLPVPFLILGLFLPVLQSSRIYEAFLAGKRLFNIQVKYISLSQIISTGIIALTLLFTKKLSWIIAIYFISNSFLNYFFYLKTKSKFTPNKKEDPKTISYAKHLTLMAIISSIANYLDRILLFTLIGSKQLAVYSFAIIVPDQIKSLIKQNVGGLAFPKLSIKPKKEIKTSIMGKFWKLLLFTGIITLVYILIAPLLYKILFPKYIESISYSQLYALTFITIPASLLTTIFRAQMMKKELYLLRIVPLIQITLLLILTPTYGILGVIIGQIGTVIFHFILVFFLVNRKYKNV